MCQLLIEVLLAPAVVSKNNFHAKDVVNLFLHAAQASRYPSSAVIYLHLSVN